MSSHSGKFHFVEIRREVGAQRLAGKDSSMNSEFYSQNLGKLGQPGQPISHLHILVDPIPDIPVIGIGWAGWAGWRSGPAAGNFVVECNMAADPEAEKLRDLARLDSALDKIEKILTARAPNDAHPTFVQALDTAQLKAIDRIVPLLERRAAMLGYDAPKADAKASSQSGSLAELEQKLALSDRLGRGGAS